MSDCRAQVDRVIAVIGLAHVPRAKRAERREQAYRAAGCAPVKDQLVAARPTAPTTAPTPKPLDEAFMALAKRNSCLACHTADKSLVGPSFADIARKYRNDPAAQRKLERRVLEGTRGTWGQVPMPPNATVSERDTKLLVERILGSR